MIPLIQLKQIISAFLIVFGLAFFGLPSTAQAVSPPPDGGYPGLNTAEGQNALFTLAGGGFFNTALGAYALSRLNAGSDNTAVGTSSLESDLGGNFNTAVGVGTLNLNTADLNCAFGAYALFSNTAGTPNTAIGVSALANNTTGSHDTAIGFLALFDNTIGNNNTALGENALMANTSGAMNTACGIGALGNNTTSGFNIGLGEFAGANLTTGSNNIDIGSAGFAGEHDTIRIGAINHIAAFIDGIYAVNEGTPAVPVYISSGGQLGTAPPPSSRRFKNQIKSMDKVSEAILALKPVTFQYKSDPKNTPQFGLIAEEVEQVNPDLVVHDKDGKPYSVRYDQVNAMLLNEFLKEHKAFVEEQHRVEKLEANLAQQQNAMEALSAHLKEQHLKFQRVSDQIEINKTASKVVSNDP